LSVASVYMLHCAVVTDLSTDRKPTDISDIAHAQ